MRKLIALLSILIPFGLGAQISINSSHMPQSGDTLRFSTALPDTSVLLNFQTPGANQVWNFDSLVPLRQGVMRIFKLFSDTDMLPMFRIE